LIEDENKKKRFFSFFFKKKNKKQNPSNAKNATLLYSSKGGTTTPALLVNLTGNAGLYHNVQAGESLTQSNLSSVNSISYTHNIFAKITRISTIAKLSTRSAMLREDGVVGVIYLRPRQTREPSRKG
jgi:hypothetical protein